MNNFTSRTIGVALLGDSVFDSRRYMHGQPHLAERLRERLEGGTAALLAISGSRLADMPDQIARIPSGTTHVVVSVGGNDLLDLGRRIGMSPGGLPAAIGLFLDFRRRYASFCDQMRAKSLKTAVCTVYLPPIRDPFMRDVGAAAIQMVDAAIREEATRRGIDVIDLSSVCHRPEDFIDPIHPSPTGADKIADAIANWIRQKGL